ncbi:MAG TPA: hypothetical protein VLM79_25210 [Kofleriaceae bacterium]|nr:hypothetical protein [Kofleriaceae bacterium]
MTWALEPWAIPAQIGVPLTVRRRTCVPFYRGSLPLGWTRQWTLPVHPPIASAQFYVPECGTSIAETCVMQTLRPIALAIAALGFVAIAGCTTDSGPDATLRVRNDSNFVIEQLYLTQVNNSDWGPNRLGNDVLFPDEQITLGVNCDTYDARLVDEDNVDCEIHDRDLCLNDSLWIIRDNTCTFVPRNADGQKSTTPADKTPASTTL